MHITTAYVINDVSPGTGVYVVVASLDARVRILINLFPLGVRFKVVKVANVALNSLYSGKKERPRS